VPERWRSSAARKLVAAVRKAGGDAERAGVGRIKITGPKGTLTIHEPSGDTRRDLRSEGAAGKIAEATGLEL
jgi:hypothetical protein